VPLHPVIAEKLSAALEPAAAAQFTPRDERLPPIAGKVHWVIGRRRETLRDRRAAMA
jgi:hypothetical protein